jgi:hypothetical protein
MKSQFAVGDLVRINSGYSGGIWLRPVPGTNLSPESGHVFDGVLVVLETDHGEFPRDPSVRVISSCGKVGWTFESRLRKVTE